MKIKNINRVKLKEWIDMWDILADSIVDTTCKEKGLNSHDNEGCAIALMHSELSEALEAYRVGNPNSKKIPEFSEVAEELADCVIRIMAHGVIREEDIANAIIKKMVYNEGRPFKHGGKLY